MRSERKLRSEEKSGDRSEGESENDKITLNRTGLIDVTAV